MSETSPSEQSNGEEEKLEDLTIEKIFQKNRWHKWVSGRNLPLGKESDGKVSNMPDGTELTLAYSIEYERWWIEGNVYPPNRPNSTSSIARHIDRFIVKNGKWDYISTINTR